MTNTIRCEYSIKTPDDEHYICLKHVEFFTRIKLRNSASCYRINTVKYTPLRNELMNTYSYEYEYA